MDNTELIQNNKRQAETEEYLSNANKRTGYIDNSTDHFDPRELNPSLRVVDDNLFFIDHMGYPEEYLEIFKIERSRRVFNGLEGLELITNSKVFVNAGEQMGKERIQQVTNINCIKSRDPKKEIMETKRIVFTNFSKKVLKDCYGIDYFNFDENNEIEKYINRIKQSVVVNKLRRIVHEKKEALYETLHDPDSFHEKEIKKRNMEYREAQEDYSNEIKLEREIVTDSLLRDHEQHYKTMFPSNFHLIVMILSGILGEKYRDFVCIAGGFSLAQYMKQNYDQDVDFGDIDLFIHSCDEATANEIVYHISKAIPNIDTFLQNKNAIHYGSCNPMLEGIGFHNLKLQIIKRLYTSPAQVIAGFDIDCCCVLTTMNNEIFTSQRGLYALRNGYNVFNFGLISPSYEFRLNKYNLRGFGIWIPFIDYFKEVTYFDINVLDYDRGSSRLIRKLIEPEKYDPEDISDYNDGSDHVAVVGYISFHVFNFHDPVIGTFNRMFMTDFLDWYPKDLSYKLPTDYVDPSKKTLTFDDYVNGAMLYYNHTFQVITTEEKFINRKKYGESPEEKLDLKIISKVLRKFEYLKRLTKLKIVDFIDIKKFREDMIIDINKDKIGRSEIIAKNIIRRIPFRSDRDDFYHTKRNAELLIEYINSLRQEYTVLAGLQNENRDIYILGLVPESAVFGYLDKHITLNFWTPIPMTDDEFLFFNYNITIFRTKMAVFTCLYSDQFKEKDFDYNSITYEVFKDICRVVFVNNENKNRIREISDEESLHIFQNSKQIESLSLLEIYNDLKKVFNRNNLECIPIVILDDDKSKIFKDKEIIYSVVKSNLHIQRNTTSIEITRYIEESGEEEIGNVMYVNGNYYGVESTLGQFVNYVNKNTDIFDYPVHQNFIP
jgi:hypothetical protein